MFSPNPDKPPSYVDVPCGLVDGNPTRIDSACARWTAHTPMVMLARYGPNPLLYRGVAFDVGLRDNEPDGLIGARALVQALRHAHIPYQCEEHDGNHIAKVPERMGTDVLPFVSGDPNPPRRVSETR